MQDQEQEMVGFYHEGLSSRQVGKKLGLSDSTVRRHLRKAGVALRSRSQANCLRWRGKTQIAEDWSFIPLTPDKAWLLGLIYSDGNLASRGAHISLVSKDYDLLGQVNRIMGGKLNIRHRKGVSTYEIVISSQRLCSELVKIGLHPRKSLTITFPTLPEDALPHFVRGLIDGDGCWYLDKSRQACLNFTYTSGSGEFVESLRSHLISQAGVSSNTHTIVSQKRRKSELKHRHSDSVKIGEWVYRASQPTNRLKRKYQKWLVGKNQMMRYVYVNGKRVKADEVMALGAQMVKEEALWEMIPQ